MAHLVAGYPDRAGSLEAARGLIDGGCTYLEVQFPFSDPTADGPLIQEACDRALKAGFRLAQGLELLEAIRGLSAVPLFVMSYANPVVVRGVGRFLAELRRAGAAGVIVPDLPVDSDEGLYAEAMRRGLHAVPVVSPNSSAQRLELLRPLGLQYLYATLRGGITGAYTEVGAESLAFLHRLHDSETKVLAGFGISTREQVRALEPHVHAVVAGSVFVREIQGVLAREKAESRPAPDGQARGGSRGVASGLCEALRARMRELGGPSDQTRPPIGRLQSPVGA
jgi:tryptophan synthase alpha chain